VNYWQHTFDWRKQEKFLNQFDHFKTYIDGIDVHFLHVKAKKPKNDPNFIAKPLLLIHGWPGSVYEFYQILPILTDPGSYGGDPNLAFDVVAPSLPGYGFSSAPKQRGFDVIEAALIFAKLMKRLGYSKYMVQGGDWGGLTANAVGTLNPENCAAVHVNIVFSSPTTTQVLQCLLASVAPNLAFSEIDQKKLLPFGKLFAYVWRETGYMHEQATRPYTLAHGLSDSPAGLAAWISEKFQAWSDCDGDVYKRFTKDQLLTNIMIYWVTNSISSSLNLYKETLSDSKNVDILHNAPVEVPTGFIEFPKEIVVVPRSWVEDKFQNLVSYSVAPRGGHFAAMEEPQVLAEDIWKFIKLVKW